MSSTRPVAGLLAAISLALPAIATADHQSFQHVLLISIDGMHAVDYQNCVATGTCPNLAHLGKNGVQYTRTSTARPSDSFPGLMAIVSGGTPKTVGAFYDVAYDRVLAPPATTTGNGVAGGTCTPGVPNGTTTEYEEGIDLDQTQLNGGTPGAALTEGGIASIDPNKLPRDPMNACSPVWPWNFVRTNTIFGVVHDAGGYVAWSDKHPAYSSVAGPGKHAKLDDFYSPEINSNVVPLPNVFTATGINCGTVQDPTSDTSAWTNSFANIQCYDALKVNAILNQIKGRNHQGTQNAPVPMIFGMNFQAVSVGQKLIEKTLSPTVRGGYLDAQATPSPALASEIAFVDASIGNIVSELKRHGLFESTLIVITAKHGQSPIDPKRWVAQAKVGSTPATVLDNAGCIPFSEAPSNPTGIGPTEDDISQIWLNSSCTTDDAVALLQQNADQLAIDEIFHGNGLTTMFKKPGIPPNGDPRVPDIIVQPSIGHTYTGSSKKQAEHGGFAFDDTNVMLLVSNPTLRAGLVNSFVETTQVAPTILQALGFDPRALDSVRIEGTPVLPNLYW
ncbi:MAG TPA: alkaline phosphatase family protein [Steroidobacteraceae bacterium]|nr:alkaline phosphatase family protein [Steroidobacteraceae bacterium]